MTTSQGGDAFVSVDAKIRRGNEHLKVLNDAILEWAKPESYRSFGEFNDDRTVYMVGIRFLREPDFVKWAAITGDILTNYRSALDHLVYSLAVVSSGADPPPHESRLAFPITSSKGNFDAAIKGRRLFGLPSQTITTIKTAQPHNRTDEGGTALTRLRDLNDPDKHRKLNLGVFAVQHPESIEIGPVKGPFTFEITGEPLYDGAPIGRIDFPEPHPPMQVNLDLSMRIRLADETPGGPAIVVLLDSIRSEVTRIVNTLRP